MTSTAEHTIRKASSARPRPAILPPSPHTPLLSRSVSSLYGSPSSSLRSEDDPVIFEFGARFLRCGFAGEARPRCTLSFGPETQTRIGDYRHHLPPFGSARRKRKRGEEWGQAHELWRMDLRNLDLGLVEDKLERALREAYNKFFLLDAKPKKVVLAVPTALPRPLVATALSLLFTNFQAPAITLLPSPVLCTVAAGLRSALVVDIGWAETTVTAIYEYREVSCRRSIRAGRLLSEEMGKMLTAKVAVARGSSTDASYEEVSFEEADEVLLRMGWCQPHAEASSFPSYDKVMEIPLLAASPPLTLNVPFPDLALPAEQAFFPDDPPYDDHEPALPTLLHTTLLNLPIDVRKTCLSRIVIVGGVSNLPGLKQRLLDELSSIVVDRGWDPVRNYGSAASPVTSETESPGRRSPGWRRPRWSGQRGTSSQTHDTLPELPHRISQSTETEINIPASEQPQELDPIAARIAAQAAKEMTPSVEGMVRCVESLGAWSGASLVAGLRVQGEIQMEKELFLSRGLTAAKKGLDGI